MSSVLAEVRESDGRKVVLLARIWHEKIVRKHPELADYQADVLEAVAKPDHAEPDLCEQRRRYYRRHAGPSRWLLVVVSFEQMPGRIITAVAQRKDPEEWNP